MWVQTDEAVIERRNRARVANGETTSDCIAGWIAEELPFVAARRPWEHADLIVAGAPALAHYRQTEIVVADGPVR